MQGEQLGLATLRDALDDAWEAGVEIVRLYGGEPLLHKDLPAIVRHATDLGLRTYVTTNGTLLKLRFDELHAAGLRLVTVGFYGFEEAYDGYVQRAGTSPGSATAWRTCAPATTRTRSRSSSTSC